MKLDYSLDELLQAIGRVANVSIDTSDVITTTHPPDLTTHSWVLSVINT
jgi:hypothetical protein